MASYSVTFIITDSSGTPLSGATVYIDGLAVGSGSTVTSQIDAGNHELVVQCSGYQAFIGGQTAFDSAQAVPVALEATTQTTGTVNFTLQVVPDVAGNYAFIPLNGSSSTVTGSLVGGGISTMTLQANTPYDVVISVADPGYDNTTNAIDTTTQSGVTLALTATADDTSSNQPTGSAPGLTDVNGFDPATRDNLLTKPDFVFPNSVDGKYFTSTQARMYIGNVFIDEVNFVQFVLQDNKIPVYGYRSRYMDAVAQGRSLVQGQLGINLVSEGYLRVVLDTYDQLMNSDAVPDDFSDVLAQLDELDTKTQTTAIIQQRNQLLAGVPPSVLDQLKTRRQASALATDDQVSGYSAQSVYADVPFDLEIELTGGGRTITRRLEDCLLISDEMVLDQSGTALADGYGFIARRLR